MLAWGSRWTDKGMRKCVGGGMRALPKYLHRLPLWPVANHSKFAPQLLDKGPAQH